MSNDNETVEQVCKNLIESAEELRRVGEYIPCSLAIFRAKDILAAHKRELAAKDAEIESMRRTVKYYEGVVSAKCKENESGLSLIKEFVELLNKLIPNECYRVCGKDPCDHIAVLEDIKTNGGEPCPCVLLSALIAKAREVVSNG